MTDTNHRQAELTRFVSALTDTRAGLRILGVSGPGGVGKSYLMRLALEAARQQDPRFLTLSVDGASEASRHDFFALVEGQLARSALPPPTGQRQDNFPRTRRIATLHRELCASVEQELGAAGAPDGLKGAALALLKAGRRLNDSVPKTREYFDVRDERAPAEVTQALDEAWRVVSALRALRSSRSIIPERVRDALGLADRARVRGDLYNATADAMVADLAATMTLGLDRVVITVDDFEALAPTLEDFLVGALVPRLANAPFPTLLVTLGRDQLDAMHPGWNQHCQQYLLDPIRLLPFRREVAMDMLAQAGVPEERREALFEATQGFPFLLSLAIEEQAQEGADTALFLRRFFDRTTRWMSTRERGWFERVCYLDRVNVDTLRPLFPDEDVEAIQDWFERESSIRDPSASVFRVRPLIREKVMRYLELRAPTRHRETLEMVGSDR